MVFYYLFHSLTKITSGLAKSLLYCFEKAKRCSYTCVCSSHSAKGHLCTTATWWSSPLLLSSVPKVAVAERFDCIQIIDKKFLLILVESELVYCYRHFYKRCSFNHPLFLHVVYTFHVIKEKKNVYKSYSHHERGVIRGFSPNAVRWFYHSGSSIATTRQGAHTPPGGIFTEIFTHRCLPSFQ